MRRPVRPWTPAVHDLLRHLGEREFVGAPRALGVDREGREVLSHLAGDTVGGRSPWPAWVHADHALVEVGGWLRRYHAAVIDYVPPEGARWRGSGVWQPGMVVGHGDPAPYNAVWDHSGLVGLIDWDDAGPVSVAEDLAWVAFAWTPLHAPQVVAREGFTEFGRRRQRLAILLDAYGWSGTIAECLAAVETRLTREIGTLRDLADQGDPSRLRMVAQGLDRALETARAGLADL